MEWILRPGVFAVVGVTESDWTKQSEAGKLVSGGRLAYHSGGLLQSINTVASVCPLSAPLSTATAKM